MLRRFLGIRDPTGGHDRLVETRAGSDSWPVAVYAEDCVLRGRIRITGERLLDMVNGQGGTSLASVSVEALDDGHRLTLPTLEVTPDELIAITMAGPRGNESRRRATRAVPAAIRIGPYRIWGLLHSMLSADPHSALHGHRVMVPLTDATITYEVAGELRQDVEGGLIVNRERIEGVDEPITESDALALDLDRTYGITGRVAHSLEDAFHRPASPQAASTEHEGAVPAAEP